MSLIVPGPVVSFFVESIQSFANELDRLRPGFVLTVVVGDLNVHHTSWLKHSSHTSPEGEAMRLAAADMGLHQRVRNPTPGKHMLDLALTDVRGAIVRLLRKIADHSIVEMVLPMAVPETSEVHREVWLFSSARWEELNNKNVHF